MWRVTIASVMCTTLLIPGGAGFAEEGPPKRDPSKAPKTGDPAPDFTLKALHGDDTFTISSFQNKKPVVLFFGSYT